MPAIYTRERLTEAVAASRSWADLMRTLGVKASGGRRRVLQEQVRALGIDASHFVKQSPWRKYPDSAIAEAVSSCTTLREVADKLGSVPATGTLSHIRRRIAALGLDVHHFPGLNRERLKCPFSEGELRHAAGISHSVRGTARTLGLPDDGRSRAALHRALTEYDIDTSHFAHRRLVIPEDALRTAVAESPSYADVMRKLGLPVDEVNYRRVQRQTVQLGISTTHFVRCRRRTIPAPRRIADDVLVVLPQGSPRPNHSRLRRALDEIGVAYACARCANPGEWDGEPMTLQIDHINGDWLDNGRENLRYLCPNCHAITDTWCGRNRGRRSH